MKPSKKKEKGKTMNKQLTVTALCLMISFTPLWGQSWNSSDTREFKADLGFEYFQRTVSLGENTESSSRMRSLIFNIGADYYIQRNISAGVFAGYSLSVFDQVVFRELPFSLQLNEETLNGVLFGARFTAGSLYVSQFEIKSAGRFVYCVGLDQNWDVPGLAETGKASGKADWMQVAAGPVVYYAEPLIFSPYMAVQFNYLWGSFSINEKIGNLSGTEEKEIKAKGYVSVSAGGVAQLTSSLELNANINLIPAEGGVDFGIMINIAYVF